VSVENGNWFTEISKINYYKNDLKNLLALIFITNCLLKRFQTEGNTYSLKRFMFTCIMQKIETERKNINWKRTSWSQAMWRPVKQLKHKTSHTVTNCLIWGTMVKIKTGLSAHLRFNKRCQKSTVSEAIMKSLNITTRR